MLRLAAGLEGVGMVGLETEGTAAFTCQSMGALVSGGSYKRAVLEQPTTPKTAHKRSNFALCANIKTRATRRKIHDRVVSRKHLRGGIRCSAVRANATVERDKFSPVYFMPVGLAINIPSCARPWIDRPIWFDSRAKMVTYYDISCGRYAPNRCHNGVNFPSRITE